ncbi:hypothetical protein Tco_1540652 [Tanacetum coccineum]
MTTVNQGISVEEIERVVAQRLANAIEAIAIYETKTNMARKSMIQIKRQEDKVTENASNKRKWEVKLQNRVDMYWKGKACGDTTKTKAVKYDLPGIEDMVPNIWSPVKNQLTNLSGDDVADFAIALRMFTRSLVIQKRVEDLQLEFSDGTLTRLLSSLDDITKNIDMKYLSKRRWSNLEKKRAHFMIKDINKLLKERRMMRNLEKFVGGRLYGWFDTPAGNPVKKILRKLNLSNHRSILTDLKEYLKMVMERESVKVKEIQERCIIKAFQDYQIKKGMGMSVQKSQVHEMDKFTRWREIMLG